MESLQKRKESGREGEKKMAARFKESQPLHLFIFFRPVKTNIPKR